MYCVQSGSRVATYIVSAVSVVLSSAGCLIRGRVREQLSCASAFDNDTALVADAQAHAATVRVARVRPLRRLRALPLPATRLRAQQRPPRRRHRAAAGQRLPCLHPCASRPGAVSAAVLTRLQHHLTKDEWMLPKGRKDEGESIEEASETSALAPVVPAHSPHQAAVRETYEETGYPCSLFGVDLQTRCPPRGVNVKVRT